ncbi:cytoskeletal protein RodZ [Desulfitispora alkaliphila]|uniref:helix-turn-helix domain-containing protein n=1 Tax=Desulfitispora alkaliphila TaxID=622674 RepID=UPI003D194853
MKVGQMLKQARKEKGISVREAEEKIKIKGSFIEAIEDEDFSKIPGRIYVIGFLRSYAKFLGLNTEEVVNMYKSEYPEKEPSPVEQEEVKGFEKRNSNAYYVIIASGLVVVLFFGAMFFSNQQESDNIVSENDAGISEPINQGEEIEIIDEEEPEPQEETPKPVAEYDHVEVIVDIQGGPCWVEVVKDGRRDYTGMLQPGETYKYIGESQVQITFGDAATANVTFNGEDVGIVGGAEQVVTKTYQLRD